MLLTALRHSPFCCVKNRAPCASADFLSIIDLLSPDQRLLIKRASGNRSHNKRGAPRISLILRTCNFTLYHIPKPNERKIAPYSAYKGQKGQAVVMRLTIGPTGKRIFPAGDLKTAGLLFLEMKTNTEYGVRH